MSTAICHTLIPEPARRYLANRLWARAPYLVRPTVTSLAGLSPLLERTIRDLCADIHYELENRNRDRMSDEILAFMLASPHKYADTSLDEQIPMAQRISGQILPFLEPVLDQHHATRVLEIGACNGVVLSWLAAKYPRIHFVGIDLHIPPRVKALETTNLTFMSGYALDVLEQGSLPQIPDAVFCQFTAANVLPRECERYFQLFRRLGISWVVLNEPTRNGFPVRANERRSRSIYLGSKMWRHDYPGLARRAGYEIVAFQDKHWSQLIEPRYNRVRFDTHLVQMSARLRERGK
ncbi:MAG: hypothetical protein HYZ89_00450 [Candidatus Omnitrophica bacterium]|nr:hypothetical protein [Candidatus Omnitrophota bacterium]